MSRTDAQTPGNRHQPWELGIGMSLKIPAFAQSHVTSRISQRLLRSTMGRGVLWDPVPMISLGIFPAGNMQGKDISRLFVQISTGLERAMFIPPCSHHKSLPSCLLCAVLPPWQPSCPCRQHKPGEAAGRKGLSPSPLLEEKGCMHS